MLGEVGVVLANQARVVHVRGKRGGEPLVRLGGLPGVEFGKPLLAIADGDVVRQAGEQCDTATVHVWVVALMPVYSIRSRIFTLPPGWVRVTRKASMSNALPPSGLALRKRMTSSMPSPLKSPKAH